MTRWLLFLLAQDAAESGTLASAKRREDVSDGRGRAA
jgi:hypothetical protein